MAQYRKMQQYCMTSNECHEGNHDEKERGKERRRRRCTKKIKRHYIHHHKNITFTCLLDVLVHTLYYLLFFCYILPNLHFNHCVFTLILLPLPLFFINILYTTPILILINNNKTTPTINTTMPLLSATIGSL